VTILRECEPQGTILLRPKPVFTQRNIRRRHSDESRGGLTWFSYLSRLFHRISVSPFPNLSSFRSTLTRKSPTSSTSHVADCIAAERSSEGEVAALSALERTFQEIAQFAEFRTAQRKRQNWNIPRILSLRSVPSA
jgi:hypothetical protein